MLITILKSLRLNDLVGENTCGLSTQGTTCIKYVAW